jgi:hypothetical protein
MGHRLSMMQLLENDSLRRPRGAGKFRPDFGGLTRF